MSQLELRFGLGFAFGRFSGDVGASYDSALASPLAVSGVNGRYCRWCRNSSYDSALASPLAVSRVTLRLLLLPLQLWLRFGLGFAFGRCLGDVAVVAVGVDVE